MSLEQAIATLKAAGYRVSKPAKKKVKDRVGPTFEAMFADGTVTRMSIFTSLADLDIGRGVRLSALAWESRKRNLPVWRNSMMDQELLAHCRARWEAAEHTPPAIVAARFEQDGQTLREYSADELNA